MEGADDQQLLSWMDGIRSTAGLYPDRVRKALHEVKLLFKVIADPQQC